MMKYLVFFLLTISSLLHTGCFFRPQTYTDTRFLMDTTINITVYGSNQDDLVPATTTAFNVFKDVADETDRYESHKADDLYALNQKAGQGPFTPGKHLAYLLNWERKMPYKEVDLTLGPLIDLWKRHSTDKTVPSGAELQTALAQCGKQRYTIDATSRTVTLTTGTNLDLGAIAKGYAVDCAAASLKQEPAVKAALINAGGNIKVLGTKPDKKPWKIGIQDPRNNQKILGTLSLQDGMSVATSGDYQRFYEVDGIRYHHILNPATGLPSNNARSTTAVAESALTADYYSTLLFVLPHDEAIKVVENTPGLEAVILSNNHELYVSSGLQDKFIPEK